MELLVVIGSTVLLLLGTLILIGGIELVDGLSRSADLRRQERRVRLRQTQDASHDLKAENAMLRSDIDRAREAFAVIIDNPTYDLEVRRQAEAALEYLRDRKVGE